MGISITASRCPQNHPCPAVRICPSGALTQHGNSAPVVDPEKCTNCGLCVEYCGFGALR